MRCRSGPQDSILRRCHVDVDGRIVLANAVIQHLLMVKVTSCLCCLTPILHGWVTSLGGGSVNLFTRSMELSTPNKARSEDRVSLLMYV